MQNQDAKQRHARSKNFLNRLRRDDDGVSAVEFGLVALPFLAFILAFIEVALVYGGTVSMEHALEKVSRKIRVGQPAASLDDFKTQVCAEVVMLADCNSKLIVDVRAFPNFANLESSNVLDDYSDPNGDLNDPDPDGGQYEVGEGESIVLVTAFYKWDLMVNIPGLLGFGLGNQTDGTRMISGAAAFRNEPF